MAQRFFCVAHGFVKPEDVVMPTCPDCGETVTAVGGTPVLERDEAPAP